MGKCIASNSFPLSERVGTLEPIIYCNFKEKEIPDAVSLNKLLAEKLNACKANRRSFRLERIFAAVMSEMSEDVVIKDFDVLFNPEYKVDILSIFIAVCKRKKFQILWPGNYTKGKLYYAKPGFSDYKCYNIDNYDITCVYKEEEK